MRSLLKITSKGLAAAANGCLALVQLEMKQCHAVDDVGFLVLVQYAKNLRQVNLSYCPITDVALCMLVGNLSCLQDVKLLHLPRVSVHGFEFALRAGWRRLKKVKLHSSLLHLLSTELLQVLHCRGCRGCRLRWVDKPLVI